MNDKRSMMGALMCHIFVCIWCKPVPLHVIFYSSVADIIIIWQEKEPPWDCIHWSTEYHRSSILSFPFLFGIQTGHFQCGISEGLGIECEEDVHWIIWCEARIMFFGDIARDLIFFVGLCLCFGRNLGLFEFPDLVLGAWAWIWLVTFSFVLLTIPAFVQV